MAIAGTCARAAHGSPSDGVIRCGEQVLLVTPWTRRSDMPVMWRRGARTWVLVWALAAGACSTQSASTADAKSDRPPAGSAQRTQSVPPSGYEGFLEVVSCDILSGWAWSPSQ